MDVVDRKARRYERALVFGSTLVFLACMAGPMIYTNADYIHSEFKLAVANILPSYQGEILNNKFYVKVIDFMLLLLGLSCSAAFLLIPAAREEWFQRLRAIPELDLFIEQLYDSDEEWESMGFSVFNASMWVSTLVYFMYIARCQLQN